MKILLDMDQKIFHDALMENNLPGKLVGTEKDMTMDIMYSKSDIWNKVNDSMFSDEQIDRIHEEIGVDRFCEAIIDRINHMERDLGITAVDIDSAIWDAYDHDFPFKVDRENDTGDNISLDGLRTALQRYGDSGVQGICGSWDVHDGGYDLQFEICYQGQSVVGCYGRSMFSSEGELERHINMPDKTFSEICDLVHSAFPECSMSKEEQEKIDRNKQEHR